MARYKNVRRQDSKPEQPQNAEEANQAYVDSVRSIADQLFEHYGGHDLEESLATMRETLALYREEIQRARKCEDPDNFKWLVKPSEGIRAEREVTRLNQFINALRERCFKEAQEGARELIEHHHQVQIERAKEELRKREQAKTESPEPERVEATKENTTAPPTTRAA